MDPVHHDPLNDLARRPVRYIQEILTLFLNLSTVLRSVRCGRRIDMYFKVRLVMETKDGLHQVSQRVIAEVVKKN